MQEQVLVSHMERREQRNISLLCCHGRAEVWSFQKGGNLPDVITWSFKQGLTGVE